MNAIHPESEIVATTFDTATGICSYTIERGGKRWTARVHVDELNKYKNDKMRRRQHVAAALQQAMMGPPDE
jgi:hypothetical protein